MKQFPLSLLLAAVLGIGATPAHALQQGPLLMLDYNGQTECEFQTTSGISVSGTTPGVILANGSFGSGCPTGGGATPPAAATLTTSMATVNEGDSATIAWSGTGDVCRYDGSVLPAAVNGWLTSGDACIGATECAAGNSITPTFTVGGTYTFKLTCISGAHDQQLETSAVKIVAVQVNGSTPPVGNCVAPQGLTRQTVGNIAIPSGAYFNAGVSVETWGETFGWSFSDAPPYEYYTWPGLGNSIKFYVEEGKYISLRFTVPPDYPYYVSSPEAHYGQLVGSPSQTDVGEYSVTITPDCGDFMRPAAGARDYYCYRSFTGAAGGFGWAVLPVGANAPLFSCPLERGQTYYLNITKAPLNDPLNQDANNTCSGGKCRINIGNGGDIEGDYEQIP